MSLQKHISITKLRKSVDNLSDSSSSDEIGYMNKDFKYQPRTPPVENPGLIIKRRISSNIESRKSNSGELLVSIEDC